MRDWSNWLADSGSTAGIALGKSQRPQVGGADAMIQGEVGRMAPSCGTSRLANAASAHVLNSSIPGRLSYLLVVSIVAFLTCGTRAAPAGHGTDASAPQATLTRKSVVGHASFYSPRMNGHKTATGERFSSHKMTAAAKGIPPRFGCDRHQPKERAFG